MESLDGKGEDRLRPELAGEVLRDQGEARRGVCVGLARRNRGLLDEDLAGREAIGANSS